MQDAITVPILIGVIVIAIVGYILIRKYGPHRGQNDTLNGGGLGFTDPKRSPHDVPVHAAPHVKPALSDATAVIAVPLEGGLPMTGVVRGPDMVLPSYVETSGLEMEGRAVSADEKVLCERNECKRSNFIAMVESLQAACPVTSDLRDLLTFTGSCQQPSEQDLIETGVEDNHRRRRRDDQNGQRDEEDASEATHLLPAASRTGEPKPQHLSASSVVPLVILVSLALFALAYVVGSGADDRCPQLEPLYPRVGRKELAGTLLALDEDGERLAAAGRLGRAVQIPTVGYDEMMAGPDPEEGDGRYGDYLRFITFLEETYPKVHATLKRHFVNHFSIIYEWVGTDPEGHKPLMLCAHIDVVPVLNDTIPLWQREPFSGDVEVIKNVGKKKAALDGWIWGRGSVDDKGELIAMMEAAELLLANGFRPRKTHLFAFGHDEETSGRRGAGAMAAFLENTMGLRDGVGMIIDEGTNIREYQGSRLALVSVSEKGYEDLELQIRTPGGHSSLPPDHTAIGMMADVLLQLERNPHPSSMPLSHPFLTCLACVARHGGSGVNPFFRMGVNHANVLAPLLVQMINMDPQARYMIRTSQAADIIKGGVKRNALPEVVTAVVNHRVAVDGSTSKVEARVFKLLKGVARRHRLNMTLYGKAG
ncbi:hypothetical protein HK101_010779, partial [Irineochytrium annulatum]